ncbi:MAG: hypothetical protein M3485_00635 [Pseudomonadota bacterium]|nr:hypothetical protein [Pseudomonadota bacterium]
MIRLGKFLPAAIAFLLSTFTVPAACEEQASQASGKRGYIETSYLIAPRQVAAFVLESARYDPDQKYAGAGFRYLTGHHQETRIDVYVYPAGRMDQTTALGDGMKAFRADIERAVAAGQYTNLRLQDETDFSLVDRAPAAASGSTGDQNATEILNTISDAIRPEGRKLLMSLNIQPHDWPMHSVGYLFYRQLYYFKVRATAAQERVSADDFHTLADHVAHTLVPAIEVVNVGDCANSVINLSTAASTEEIAKSLVTQAATHQGYNCHSTTEAAGMDKKRKDTEVVEISYSLQEWRSE